MTSDELAELFVTSFRYITFAELGARSVFGIDGDDVLQEAYIRCLRAFERGEEKIQHPEAFARGVLRNVTMEFRRMLQRRSANISFRDLREAEAELPKEFVTGESKLLLSEKLDQKIAALRKAVKGLDSHPKESMRRGMRILRQEGSWGLSPTHKSNSDRLAKNRSKARLTKWCRLHFKFPTLGQ